MPLSPLLSAFTPSCRPQQQKRRHRARFTEQELSGLNAVCDAQGKGQYGPRKLG